MVSDNLWILVGQFLEDRIGLQVPPGTLICHSATILLGIGLIAVVPSLKVVDGLFVRLMPINNHASSCNAVIIRVVTLAPLVLAGAIASFGNTSCRYRVRAQELGYSCVGRSRLQARHDLKK